jgi:hypothetical protein
MGSFTSLNGTPMDPSDLDVVTRTSPDGSTSTEVLVTNTGENQVFVFSLVEGVPVSGFQGSPRPESTSLTMVSESSVAFVPTLLTGESTPTVGAETTILFAHLEGQNGEGAVLGVEPLLALVLQQGDRGEEPPGEISPPSLNEFIGGLEQLERRVRQQLQREDVQSPDLPGPGESGDPPPEEVLPPITAINTQGGRSLRVLPGESQPSLALTNGDDTVSVLPGVSQDFFNDQPGRVLICTVPGSPGLEPSSFIGNCSGAAAVGGDVVAALNGMPAAPSALDLLPSGEIFVANDAQGQAIVFGLVEGICVPGFPVGPPPDNRDGGSEVSRLDLPWAEETLAAAAECSSGSRGNLRESLAGDLGMFTLALLLARTWQEKDSRPGAEELEPPDWGIRKAIDRKDTEGNTAPA